MSSFSRLRENLKIALMTTAIAAVTSVSFVEADDTAPTVDAAMSERMNDILLLSVESAYEALQEAEKTLKASTIDMIVSEGYVLESPSNSHMQGILEQHQQAYLAARNLAEQTRDHFVEEAHRSRDKGIDIGKYDYMLSRTKAKDYHLISLQDVEAAEQKLANDIRTCVRTSSNRWSCD